MGGVKGFVEGGIAAVVAGCSTHPLDLIKVRMQLQGEAAAAAAATAVRPAVAIHTTASAAVASSSSIPTLPRLGPIGIGAQILRCEGPLALFSGVSATVLRQGLYSTTRMGLYDVLKTRWTMDSPEGGAAATLPLHRKVLAGLISGAVGALVGNPADVAMVRMQADGRLPPDQRRNYRGVGDAIRSMARSEGVAGLWRGSSLTVNRAMIVTAAQLATYDQAKEALLGAGSRDGMGTHVAASFVAGMVASAASNPVDVIKTRVMNMKAKAGGGAAPYSGPIDCAVKTVRAEGVMALYKGFVPTVCRQGPFTVVLFVTLEQVRGLLKGFDF